MNDTEHSETPFHDLKELIPDQKLNPKELIEHYKNGWFPMNLFDDSHPNEQKLYWMSYDPRALIPLDAFKIPHGSRQLIRHNPYHITVDQDFEGVMRGCAELKKERPETWIDEEIITNYTELHRQGKAHSVEVRDANENLVGGLYGVSIGGVFFGESMFSRVEGAGKIALAHLGDILKTAGYTLLDVQEVGGMTAQFGAKEFSREECLARMNEAFALEPNPSERFIEAAAQVEKIKAAPPPPITSKAKIPHVKHVINSKLPGPEGTSLPPQ